ncbi:MAG TPA: hypothetical protein VF784_01950 [Anaerolineales bacterium]
MKILGRNLILAASCLSLTSACLVIQTVTPIPPGTVASVVAPTPGSSPTAATQPSPASSQPPVPKTPAGQPSGNLPLSLQVVSPQDGTVVNTNQIQVTGTASPGEVVTVNDNIILIGTDGKFQTTIALVEGPNLIEILASNDSGAETSMELTVTYAP